MKMTLAVVESCTATGCRVRLVKSDQAVETRYSAPVLKYRIQIRPGQLVAVDTSKKSPETVWRWARSKVHQVEGGRALLGPDVANESSVPLSEELAAVIAAGDEVWVYGTAEGPKVHGLVLDGKPADIERLQRLAFPTIIATYEQMENELGQS